MTCYIDQQHCLVGEEVGDPGYHHVTDTAYPEMALFRTPSLFVLRSLMEDESLNDFLILAKSSFS